MDPAHTSVRPTTPGPTGRREDDRLRRRLALTVGSGLFVGAISEWSVLHLPFDLEPLSNAAGPWILVALMAALTAPRIQQALGLSVGALLALIVGFYAAQATRGWPVDGHQVGFWCATTVVVGPLIGLAAGWLRHFGGARGAAGAGIPGGVLAGEALHGLGQPTFLSPHVFWYGQLGFGIVLSFALGLRRPGNRQVRAPPLTAAFGLTTLCTLAAFKVA